MPTTASVKFQSLEDQILRLKAQQQALLQERTHDIARLIADLNLASLDDITLAGALLFVREKITTQDSVVEAWRTAGGRFLRPKKKKKSRSPKKPAPPQSEVVPFLSHA